MVGVNNKIAKERLMPPKRLANKMSWSQLQRLKFIERQLLWERKLSSSVLVNYFGISRYQAQKDIKYYKERYPENLKKYDPVDKAYLPSFGFKPQITSEDVVEFVHNNHKKTERVPLLSERIITGLISSVLSAIDNQNDIEAIYENIDIPFGMKVSISPRAIFMVGNIMYLRAFCCCKKKHMNFELSGFRTIAQPLIQDTSEKLPIPVDEDYEQFVSIHLYANPLLNEDERDFIARKYSLIDYIKFPIRKCYIEIFLRSNNLSKPDEAKENPRLHPVIIDATYWDG